MAVRWLWTRARDRRLLAATLFSVLAVSVAGAVVAGQRAAGSPPPAGVADDLTAWLRANTTDGDRIAMTFRDREAMALRLFGSVDVANLFPTRVEPVDDPASYLWMGLRDRQLFGYRRTDWERALTRAPVRYLVSSGPHPFHPTELLDALATGQVSGIEWVASMDRDGGRAEVFSVDQTALELPWEFVPPTTMSAEAALAWLDLAASASSEALSARRLLGANPTVSGDAVPALLTRLGLCPPDLQPGGSVVLDAEQRCPG